MDPRGPGIVGSHWVEPNPCTRDRPASALTSATPPEAVPANPFERALLMADTVPIQGDGANVVGHAVEALIEPDLYECEACSAEPGSPRLCSRCLAARKAAGANWRGPRLGTNALPWKVREGAAGSRVDVQPASAGKPAPPPPSGVSIGACRWCRQASDHESDVGIDLGRTGARCCTPCLMGHRGDPVLDRIEALEAEVAVLREALALATTHMKDVADRARDVDARTAGLIRYGAPTRPPGW